MNIRQRDYVGVLVWSTTFASRLLCLADHRGDTLENAQGQAGKLYWCRAAPIGRSRTRLVSQLRLICSKFEGEKKGVLVFFSGEIQRNGITFDFRILQQVFTFSTKVRGIS